MDINYEFLACSSTQHQDNPFMVAQILEYGTREMIRALLQRPINVQLRDSTDKTPLHYLARNRHPNIFEEVRGLKFKIDSRCDHYKRTMLHHAAMVGNASSVKFLLDHGADANAKTVFCETPLFLAVNPSTDFSDLMDSRNDCIYTLIEYGADPQIYTERNIFCHELYFPQYFDSISDEQLQLNTPVFAALALLEAFGETIKPFMRDFIESDERFKSSFDSVKLQVEEMRQIEISNSVTLIDFLIFSHDEMLRFTRNRRFIANITNIMKECSSISCYNRILYRPFMLFMQFVELRDKFVGVINEVFINFHNHSIYDIAEKIFDYLPDEEWRKFV